MRASWFKRLLRIGQSASFFEWVYDRTASNWDRIVALFLGAGGITYLASVSESVAAWGPVGVGAIGILSALLIWVGLAGAQSLRAKTAYLRAKAQAIERWGDDVDNVNPLSKEFHTKRIRLSDLVNPITSHIEGKRFIDCELMGSANVLFYDNLKIDGLTMTNCDVVVLNEKEPMMVYNAIRLENCIIINCKIYGCTIIAFPFLAKTLSCSNIITLTGDPELDRIQRVHTTK